MIVDKLYYDSTYFGSTLDTTTFNKYNARAEDDIYAMAQFVYDDLQDWQQEYVKKAICAQIDYYALNGETYNDGQAASETIGRFSHSAAASGGQKSGAFAPRALQYLELAIVTCRAVNRFDSSFSGIIL